MAAPNAVTFAEPPDHPKLVGPHHQRRTRGKECRTHVRPWPSSTGGSWTAAGSLCSPAPWPAPPSTQGRAATWPRRRRRFPAIRSALGVASGDPTPNGVSLWTRLASEPLVEGGGCPTKDIGVRWQVASDSNFRHVVKSGKVAAMPELGHSVHVDVRGPQARPRVLLPLPRRAGTSSPVGRTKTAPGSRDRVPRPDVRVRVLPEVGRRVLHRRTGGWPRRTSTWSSTSATTSTSTDRPGAGAPDAQRPRSLGPRSRRSSDYRAAPRAVQDRPRPAGGPRGCSRGRHVGRPRGRQQLRGHLPRVRRHEPSSSRAARPPTGLLRAHAACPLRPHQQGGMQLYRQLRLRRPRAVQRARHAPVPHRPALRRRRAGAAATPASIRPRP